MKTEEIIETHAHHFLQDLKTEYTGDKKAVTIIQKYLHGDKLNEEDDTILRTQLWDSLKIIGVVIPFILIPGASVLMPILIRVADAHHIQLLPSADTGNKE
ncbi:MAG: hypothetical protein QM768_20260 [Agriterribacter sp.]